MKNRIASRMLMVCVCVTLLGLVGCGNGSGGGANTGSTPGSTPAGGSPTVSTTPVAGQIHIVLDKASYGVKDSITVHIANGYANSIYSAPRYTNCTVLSLQWKSSASWVPWGRCQIEQTVRLTQLNANTVTTIHFNPASSMVRPGAPVSASPLQWNPGTYRIVLSFNTTPDEEHPAALTVTSSLFTIK